MQVDPLAALLVNTSSTFYNTKASITKQLAQSVDPSLPLLSFWGSREAEPQVTEASAAPAEPETLSSKKTAIIASAAALGAILLGVGGFFSSRLYLRHRAETRRSQQELEEAAVAGTHYDEAPSPDFGPAFRPMSEAQMPVSDPFADYNQRDSMSQYPVTEGHQTEDVYNTASAATVAGAALGRPDNGRPLFDSPPLPDTANPFPHQRGLSNQLGNASFVDARHSGSGSSVQSAMLHSRRRMSSMDFALRDKWVQRSSQWDQASGRGAVGQAMIQPVQPLAYFGKSRDSRPYSASSTYSAPNFGVFDSRPGTLRNPKRHTSGKISVSRPFVQDNSLML